MLWCGICLSITLVYCVETSELVIKQLALNLWILVYGHQTCREEEGVCKLRSAKVRKCEVVNCEVECEVFMRGTCKLQGRKVQGKKSAR